MGFFRFSPALSFPSIIVMCLGTLLGAGCGDDTTPTDGGVDGGATDSATDVGDVGCVPSSERIYEPVWIAGQTGPRNEDGFFGRPDAIFIDGDILIAGDEERGDDEVLLFDLTSADDSMRSELLTPLGDFGRTGEGPLEFRGVAGFARGGDPAELFVAEHLNARVQVLRRIDAAPFYEHVRFIGMRGDPAGPADGTFNTPQALLIDPMGRLYVSDDAKESTSPTARRDVQVFQLDGTFVERFGHMPGAAGREGNLQEPENFVIDLERDRIYVCDEGEDAEDIVMYRYSDRSYVQRLGDFTGTPNGVGLDEYGNLWVVDEGNALDTFVRVLEPEGFTEIFRFGQISAENDLMPGTLNSPDTLLIDLERDEVIIADQGHDRIQAFDLSELQRAACIEE